MMGKVGITATCRYTVEGWETRAREGRVVFEPDVQQSSQPGMMRSGWSDTEFGFRDHIAALPPEDLVQIAALRLEQRITVVILPGTRKPVDAVHGVRYVFSRRVAIARRSSDITPSVLFPAKGPHPVVSLSCMLRSRSDKHFVAAKAHTHFGVKAATFLRRLELSGEDGFAAIGARIRGIRYCKRGP